MSEVSFEDTPPATRREVRPGGLRVGIDVGGTFTDLVLHDPEAGRFWVAKTPSTPSDQSVGVLRGIDAIVLRAGVAPSAIGTILHGTTVATNAVLENKGARVGLIVTEGWRSILHLAESWTPGPLFGFFGYVKPEPLVDFEDVREVPGRLNAEGRALTPLDEDAVRGAVQDLLKRGVEAICVSLLNSYANPAHERRVKELATSLTDLPVSISSEVSPEFREYPRTVTTVMNSYVSPKLQLYLGNLEQRIRERVGSAPLQVVRSDGGLMSSAAARSEPVQTVLSGPSGGVNGAALVAREAGYDRILTFDMGGTSTDVAVCIGGTPTVTRETTVGSFPVRAPSVDVESIGAGGGSIASISPVSGALRVGPDSAGAEPGPACYGRGGTLPTVTDANVVLGRLPARLLGGEMTLDVEASHAAVATIAAELGLGVESAAEGIIDIVNENMLGALRLVTVQRGLDPASFSLVSFGGAGGLHANAVAATLGCPRVLVPPEPGVLSALGFVSADVRNEFGRTMIRMLGEVGSEEITVALQELARQARDWLKFEEIVPADRGLSFVIDMRYYRQGFEIPIELAMDKAEDLEPAVLADRFRSAHEQLYGFSLPHPVEVVNVRVRAVGRVNRPSLAEFDLGAAEPDDAQVDTQPVWFDGVEQSTPIYDRSRLSPGMQLGGGAIVTQYDATTVILPRHSASVDAHGNLIITSEDR